MSRRVTPVSFMSGPRYATWAEKRSRALRRERAFRYAGAVAVVLFSCLVSWVAVAWYLGAP